MGKYDALFADDGSDDVPPAFLDRDAARGAAAAKADGGKYAALFDEPSAPASGEPDRIGRAAAAYNENVQGLRELAPIAAAPTAADAAYAGFRRGVSLGFGDESEGAALTARDLLTGRLQSGGIGATYRAHRDLARARDAAAENAAPVTAAVAEGVGGIVPQVLLPGGAAGAAAYGAAAGAGNSDADLTKGDVAGVLRDAGTSAATNALVSGAAGKLIGEAPERVDKRVLEGIARGEEGGAAKASLYKKVVARAGEDGENLADAVADDPRLQRALAVRAKSNPGAVAKMVQAKIDRLTPETDPIYAAIDNAPDPRFANPAKAPSNGGIDLGLVQDRLEASRVAALKNGRGVVAEAYDKALARLRAQYGTDGKIIPGEKLPARAMRNYANELGQGLFTGDVSPSLRAVAQQGIYRDVVGAIEDEGKRVGVDVTRLRQLNKQISTLIPVRDALADRATKAKAGGTTIGNLAMSTGLISGGAAHGGVEGALGGLALDAGRRAALPAGRMADFQLAKLVQAARNGSTAAQVAGMAAQMGLRDLAEQITRRGLSALSGTNVQDSAAPPP